ncbi:EAL domain-containing protein [Brenneria populi]|uniref:EAL domain-containing protein n=1 Tax=Brenneria populi TaxID=1505588 RepID=A0ABU6JNA6_9GAMM|nr:EAL domain-containing protein [Brenneria populi Li et al. 2015]
MEHKPSSAYLAPNSLHDEEERLIRDMQRDVLSALTSSMSFGDTGNYMCHRIQRLAPGVLVSVCRIADNRMCPWAAPDFPVEYGEHFADMEIGEGVASCGTAAYRKASVMVSDIATHPFWEPHRHVMIPHGLRSCWTYPVMRRDGSVAGTFAFYFRQTHEPDPWLERIAEASVHLCTLAIELEEGRMALTQAIQFDTLTGLPNLNNLREYLGGLVVADAPVRHVALFYVRLDRFGDINTSFGHRIGDCILIEMANRLNRYLDAGAFLARGDSDTFIIVMQDCDIHSATRVAEGMLEVIRQSVVVESLPVSLSASVGICSFSTVDVSFDEELNNARNAASRAREEGGGRYRFFDPEMNRMACDRLMLATALRCAIAKGGLRLEYQPQVNPMDGRLTGVEALARWSDPALGEISPMRFIAVAEENGDIGALSLWVMEEACRQMADWRKGAIAVPVVSVNLSPANFRDSSLPDVLGNLLQKYQLPGNALMLEITEGMIMDMTPLTMAVMTRIRGMGVGLSVDDFGTGFSSLSRLVCLPVTEIKIDRAFIRKIDKDARSRSLVAAIVSVGENLDLNVVAEGVEEEAQLSFLRQLGCPVVQGFYYSRAVPAKTLCRMISEGWGG